MTTSDKVHRICRVLEEIECNKNKYNTTYGKTGNKIPSTKYNRETGERENIFDENGNMIYEEEYADMPNENMTEEQKYEVMLWVDIETNFKKEIAKLLQ